MHLILRMRSYFSKLSRLPMLALFSKPAFYVSSHRSILLSLSKSSAVFVSFVVGRLTARFVYADLSTML